MATKTPVQTDYERIQALQAEARRIGAELKEAEAKLSRLDKVIAKQQMSNANIILLQRTRGRVNAGQPVDEAIAAVIESAREWLTSEMEAGE
jgi:hypothetical protein